MIRLSSISDLEIPLETPCAAVHPLSTTITRLKQAFVRHVIHHLFMLGLPIDRREPATHLSHMFDTISTTKSSDTETSKCETTTALALDFRTLPAKTVQDV
jgi:hypothetical protein